MYVPDPLWLSLGERRSVFDNETFGVLYLLHMSSLSSVGGYDIDPGVFYTFLQQI
jgi:hypothetical protein